MIKVDSYGNSEIFIVVAIAILIPRRPNERNSTQLSCMKITLLSSISFNDIMGSL